MLSDIIKDPRAYAGVAVVGRPLPASGRPGALTVEERIALSRLPMTEKYCRNCRRLLPIESFPKAGKKECRSGVCIECTRILNRDYRRKNRKT